MKIVLIILLHLPLLICGQSNSSIIPNKLGDYYYVYKHTKSITNFRFKLPQGFIEYRDGRDKNVIKIFRKSIPAKKRNIFGEEIYYHTEFGITIFKWKDYPKYKKFLSMSDEEIKRVIINNSNSRGKNNDPNEFIDFYDINNRFWMITGTWSDEKNLYVIICSHYTNKQSIQFSFLTNLENMKVIKDDIINLKKLIDTFEYL